MRRLLNAICILVMLGLLSQSARAFSLIGPPAIGDDAWQTPALAFQPLPGIDDLPEAPKNLGEEYRRNTPEVYYAFDANFLDYFGSNGVAAVEQAISVFNNLTNVDSPGFLSKFPLAAQRENFQAEALALTDLKSTTMQLLCEQIGLSEPERYTWVIHGRAVFTPPPCPGDVEYQIVQRNFDPLTFAPSSYVNGTLYSFVIQEFCTALPSGILADAAEFPVDPLADAFTAIAGIHGDLWGLTPNAGLIDGRFYTGLTRDDAAGLRYLWTTNNVNRESTGPGTFTYVTNNTYQLLYTSNLTAFAEAALTNTDAALAGLYPGLAYYAPATPIFTNVGTPNIVVYLTNSPTEPYGNPPQVVVATNGYTTNVLTYYHHYFANVVTNHSYYGGRYLLLQTNVTFDPTAPYPSTGETNVSMVAQTYPGISGDFYIIPTNLCDVDIVRTQLTQVILSTNLLTPTNLTATSVTLTNAAGQAVTNFTGTVSQSIISLYTNHVFVIRPVTCPTNTVELRQGIEGMKFVRKNYDSLLGQYFEPITNRYRLYAVTNGMVHPEWVERVVTTPDFLFTAQDTSGAGNAIAATVSRNLTFNSANVGAGLAGPGTIETPTVITYNKAGPTYESLTGAGALNPYTAEANAMQLPLLIWGSFDGTTNPPIVYPDGTSIENLANQVLLHPEQPTGILPSATNGVPYHFQLTASGGQPPYTWSVAPNSAALPPALSLSSSGEISGTPSISGTFDFVIRITDSEVPTPRTVDWNYMILIKTPQ